jgi:SAM-dependent methyltransferase
VIILLEAIYYIPDAEQFVRECVRVLRPGGKVLIATANKDLFDFNPSPHSYKYYGVMELDNLFSKYRFESEFYGDTPVDSMSARQKILRPIKKLAVTLDIMPKSMAGKKFFKKIVFGGLVEMPAEIGPPIPEKKPEAIQSKRAVYVAPDKISATDKNSRYKVIYCVATLK